MSVARILIVDNDYETCVFISCVSRESRKPTD